MKQKINIINSFCLNLFLLAIILVGTISCASDYFRLNFHDPDYKRLIIGRIFTDKDSLDKLNVFNVNVINENTFEMYNSTKVALKYINENEYQSDFTVELLEGNSFNIYIRTVYDKFNEKPKIRLTYNETGVYLYEIKDGGEYLIASNNEEKLAINEKKRFFIKNDGKRLKVSIDCADIFDVRTNLNISQYLIFETEDKSKLNISGIYFDSIR